MPYLPPSIWYGKKWIPGTWPGWQLAVFQSPRLHECGPADAHGNAQPFCMGKCIFRIKTPVLKFGYALEQNSSICPIISYLWMVDLVMRFFFCGASLRRLSTRIRPKKGPAPWILFLTPAPRPLQVTSFWLVKLNICVFLTWFLFRKSLCFSYMTSLKVLSLHLFCVFFLKSDHISPGNPCSYLRPGTCLKSWLLTLGILQTYPLSKSFMIDFLMPYIHGLIDQPRQKLISCHCTSGSFQEKKLGLFWYDILFLAPYHAPGPSPTVC